MQQQQQLRQRIDAIAQSLDPQKTEQVQLNERSKQLNAQLAEQEGELAKLDQEIVLQQQVVEQGLKARDRLAEDVGTAATAVATTEQDLKLQQETQARLLREQRDKQRELDKLESMTQAIQETQGTQASRMILQAGISGVHGLVAELGQVEKRYQLALETAIGGRMGFMVVEDDGVAAVGIELLKRQRGGRATFLPINKIRGSKLADIPAWKTPEGFVDHAVNLVAFDDRYRDIFSYLFGNTVVFESLASARQNLGRFRIVTLEGDLLEASGAMTGGSIRRQSGASALVKPRRRNRMKSWGCANALPKSSAFWPIAIATSKPYRSSCAIAPRPSLAAVISTAPSSSIPNKPTPCWVG
ncbi:MAG: hypothetical protein HC857_11760 [Synechococcales cyanobacterium RU_4_20]|nr:hypothetical protein [Synechococcales cyanobacterium RU_4_20]